MQWYEFVQCDVFSLPNKTVCINIRLGSSLIRYNNFANQLLKHFKYSC